MGMETMRKMKKGILFALALLMLALCACAKPPVENPPTQAKEPVQVVEDAPEIAPEEPEQPAAESISGEEHSLPDGADLSPEALSDFYYEMILSSIEIAFSDGLYFESPAELLEQELYTMFQLFAPQDALLACWDEEAGAYLYTEAQICAVLDRCFAGYSFQIEDDPQYDPTRSAIVAQTVGGFGGGTHVTDLDVAADGNRCIVRGTVRDGNGEAMRQTEYVLDFYDGGFYICAIRKLESAAMQSARTWQDVQSLLPDVSAMADFPTTDEAWHPAPIVVWDGDAEYWIDRSESWDFSKICKRKDGRTQCLYTAPDASVSQLALYNQMLYFTQTGGIFRMPLDGGAPELWIAGGGKFALAGGVMYAYLPERELCAMALDAPEQAVCVWQPDSPLSLARSVPVTGGMVFFLTDKEDNTIWVVLLQNDGKWTLLTETQTPMPYLVFSDDHRIFYLRDTPEGPFLHTIDCETGECACLGKLPDAPEGCYSPGTPLLGEQRLLMQYQGMDGSMEFYALDEELHLQQHLLSYGEESASAIYFLHLFEIQETPQCFYFFGKSYKDGLYLVTKIGKTEDGLLPEEVLREK